MNVQIHTVFNGASYRYDVDLDVSPSASDATIGRASMTYVCRRLMTPEETFKGYVIEVLRDRSPIFVIIRPQAVFGTGGNRAEPEDDPFRALIRLVTTSTHGDMRSMLLEHGRLLSVLTERYAKTAVWYMRTGGNYRDHNVAFVATLATSDPTQDNGRYRRLGAVLCSDLPMRDVARVIGIIKGTRISFRRRTTPSFWGGTSGATVEEFVRITNRTSFPRPLRAAIVGMIRNLEADPDRFDRTVLRIGTDLKDIYRRLHIKPSERADAILFKNRVPAEGVLAAYQALRTVPPQKQAQLILEHKIPFLAATSVLSSISPSVLYALVAVMTPNEIITNMAALERRGALANPEIRGLLEERLRMVVHDDQAIRMKAAQALRRLSPQGQAMLGSYLDDILKAGALKYGRIPGKTLIIVDKSGSMEAAIDAAHALTTMLGMAVDPTSVRVIAFDTVVTPILNGFPVDATGQVDYRTMKQIISRVQPYGGTSPGSAFAYLTSHTISADRIIIITDGEENTGPFLQTEVPAFFATHPRVPVSIVKVGQYRPDLESALRNQGVAIMSVDFANGDYYVLEEVLKFVAGGTVQSVVDDIDAIDIDAIITTKEVRWQSSLRRS